jgi:putative cell wall-binding protein
VAQAVRRGLLVVAALVAMATPASAAERVAGIDRYVTAASIARHTFGPSTPRAVVASGEAFPDALAAGGLHAPIYLTTRDALGWTTAASLADLDVESVWLLGGTGAVSEAVEHEIEDLGIDVTRVAGADRYATAAQVPIGFNDSPGETHTAILASGETFADALAVGPLAFKEGMPVFLTRRDSLPRVTADAIDDWDEVLIVGGTAAVSEAVEQQVRDLGVDVTRVAGANRQLTAIGVAERFDDVTHVVLARGDKFPDALAAASYGVPVLLAGDDTTAWLDDHPVAVTVLGDAPMYQWHPGEDDTWHLQLQGDPVTNIDVDAYDLDMFDTSKDVIDELHAHGRRVVCYVNAGAWEEWRPDAGDWHEEVLGEPLDGWPGERWVDVRRIDLIDDVIEERFDMAAAKGCDAVDPDNVDGFQNDTGFPLTKADSLAYNRFLISEAHERGLAVGLKNALDLVPELADEVDFAVNEECLAFDECDALRPYAAAGVPEWGVDYDGDLAEICAATDDIGAWLLADLDLDGPAQPCKTG